VLTPHIGGHTIESHVGMQNCMMANLEAFFAGKPLPYPVPAAEPAMFAAIPQN
jgi:lactate dehydrogenase-like 2-hydroxyacid dehydrogenase